MPQFDFNTFPPQIAWLVITFIILYLVMSRFALPKVGGVIEQRTSRIAGDLDEASRLQQEATRSAELYATALAEARARAHIIHVEMRSQISAELEKERHGVEVELDTKLASAEARISATRLSALSDITEIAADSAREIILALTGDQTDPLLLRGTVENLKGV
ncbi:F-type H+-transporting ATPase subunit b [Rhodoligotrophos appendicifer]|uniref:F0F1 ATP synthase subunit B family protein n=1 Tax=Rhodoligotrophos appendicifer TaxID=987056 RepID=UPI0011854018|nr:F0F1 ATP synthase subunit B' [Rhodoligotrophos appendicifer]